MKMIEERYGKIRGIDQGIGYSHLWRRVDGKQLENPCIIEIIKNAKVKCKDSL